MFNVALSLYAIFMAIYACIALAAVYHEQNYTLPGDPLRKVTRYIIGLMLILSAASLFFFFRIPWDNLLS